jgi:putative peptidoglycan lipid II flippase
MKLIKHSLSFSFATLLSRILGYVRDALIAYHFGVSQITDAFFVAFRLPNTFRRLFGEGGFNAAFVPIYAKQVKEGKEREFLGSALGYYLLINLSVVLLGVLFAESLISIIAPGLRAKPYFDLAVFMGRWVFIYLLFVGLSAFFMALLNTRGVFFVPAFAQAVFNIGFSLVIALFAQSLGYYALIGGVLVGGFLQFTFHLPFLRGIPLGFSLRLHPDVKLLFKRLIPALMGFGVAQLSFFIDTFLASFLALGAISYLYYANRIFQLPLGAISVGVANSLLSALSLGEDRSKNITLAMRFLFLLSFPSVVGLLVFSEQIVRLLYGRGNFSEADVLMVSYVLKAYSLGLVFFSLQKTLSSVFFAKGDTFTPMKTSLLAILSEGTSAIIYAFVLKLGAVGLALGTATSSLFSFGYLLRKTYRLIDWRTLMESSVKVALASLLMGLFGLFLKGKTHLLLAIPMCIILYFSLLVVFREELLVAFLRLGKGFVKKLLNP